MIVIEMDNLTATSCNILHAHWLLVYRCAGCIELFDDCGACSEEAVAIL